MKREEMPLDFSGPPFERCSFLNGASPEADISRSAPPRSGQVLARPRHKQVLARCVAHKYLLLVQTHWEPLEKKPASCGR
jgi:hypothetical protein